MSRILIVGKQNRDIEGLCSSLNKKDFHCFITPDDEKISEQLARNLPDLVIIETDRSVRLSDLARQIKQTRNSPVIALLNADMVASSDDFLIHIDDFITKPYQPGELELRIKRLLGRESGNSDEQIKCGDLIIDLAKCEVSVGGRPVLLTFKEYELLKFLAGNQERVFTRDALLNKVWGYDYYGGDRTVDVHIKRLRSKIEDANHSFIETVRNVGYRLKMA